jgi:peptidoglycan/LPS O-acetylase OafA/YrhL
LQKPRPILAPQLPSTIPSLGGLRAVSIGLVLLGHLSGTRHFPAWIHPPAMLANFGVRVFFVISGFLITTLLLIEWNETAGISLKKFYLQRTLRIFPPFYVYLAVLVLLISLDWATVWRGDLLHAFTYTMNYHHPHSWPVGHLWSLAVEEQFYLLWPLAVLLCRPTRAMKLAGAVLVLAPFIRLATWQFIPALRPDYGQQFEAVADALATGCLLAGMYNITGQWKSYQRYLRSGWFWALPALAISLAWFDHPRIFLFAGQTVMNLSIAITLERMVRYPSTPAGKLLNSQPLRFAGVLSYSLYLWQQLFLNRHSTSWVAAFPANLALAFGMALLSYYAVERPFLKLKKKLRARTEFNHRPHAMPLAVDFRS